MFMHNLGCLLSMLTMCETVPIVTSVEGMLRGESGMFDIQPVLSAIPAPISTLVTLYFALNPPLCRLWEPAGALYTSNAHRSCSNLTKKSELKSNMPGFE